MQNGGNNYGKLGYNVHRERIVIKISKSYYCCGEKIVHIKYPKCLWHILSNPEEKLTFSIIVILVLSHTINNQANGANHPDLIPHLMGTSFLTHQDYTLLQSPRDQISYGVVYKQMCKYRQ